MKIFLNKKKNSNIKLFIFIIFLILVFFLDLKKNNIITNLKNKFRNNIYNIFINPILNILNIYKNKIYIFKNIDNLLKENNILKEKILLNKIKQFKFNFYKNENLELKKILNIYKEKKEKYIIAKIKFYDNTNSMFLINKGKKDGVCINQPVLNENGIIGHVNLVNNSNSYILLICNNKYEMPVKILRNGLKFIIKGIGINNKLILNNFNVLFNEDIKEEDLLISSGMDNIYPEGYPVGYIKKIYKNKNEYYIKLEIETLFNINNINYVILIKK